MLDAAPVCVDLIKVDVNGCKLRKPPGNGPCLSRSPIRALNLWAAPGTCRQSSVCMMVEFDLEPHNSDVYTLLRKLLVFCPPLTLDMSPVDKISRALCEPG